MFDIGFWELLIVAVVSLIVLGPERLPRAMRSFQATVQKVRMFSKRMEAEINHELRVKELHENLRKIESAEDLDNLPEELKKSMQELQRAAASVNRPYAKQSPAEQPPVSPSESTAANPPASPPARRKEPGNDRK